MGIPDPKSMGVVAAVALAAGLSLVACGNGEDSPPPKTVPSLPAATADRLAVQSEQIADRLDAGDVCGAAHSADELDGAVAEAEVPAEIRAELEAATEQLVNSVNCPPPPEPKKEKKDEDEGNGDQGDEGPDQGQDEGSGPKPPGYEDLPPGLKKKFEEYEDAVLP
jgi:hypothetical protein